LERGEYGYVSAENALIKRWESTDGRCRPEDQHQEETCNKGTAPKTAASKRK
jgi:hypothetical protein